MKTALIVVDTQIDFTRGSMAVAGGPETALAIANYIEANDNRATKTLPLQYDCKFATKDWHVDPGSHWSNTPDFVDSWPVHCEAGTEGAEFDPALDDITFDAVFKKGEYEASYSGFDGIVRERHHGLDETMGLYEYLSLCGINRLIICGIATDYCVKATVMDALDRGYEVIVPSNLCAAVTEETGSAALDEMATAGATVVRDKKEGR